MRRRRGGFTLLEVLISILILVLAISTILPLFAVGMTSHKRGVDQANLSWLAPRVAAKIQEEFTDSNPADLRGYVKEQADGSILIDDSRRKLRGTEGATYTFRAEFEPMTGGPGRVPNAAFHLKVVVNFLDGGEEQAETYHTVVLRKLAR